MMPWRKSTQAPVHAYAIELYSLVMACGFCTLSEALGTQAEGQN